MGKWIDKIKNSPQPYPERTDKTDTFDPDQAQQLFADVLARLNEQCPFGAIGWAQKNKLELWKACQAALAKVEAAFKAQDMAGIKQAIAEFERANLALFEAYPGLPWRPGQKGTGSKTWQLTDQLGQELEALFAAPGVVERKGAWWYSADAWEERRRTYEGTDPPPGW